MAPLPIKEIESFITNPLVLGIIAWAGFFCSINGFIWCVSHFFNGLPWCVRGFGKGLRAERQKDIDYVKEKLLMILTKRSPKLTRSLSRNVGKELEVLDKWVAGDLRIKTAPRATDKQIIDAFHRLVKLGEMNKVKQSWYFGKHLASAKAVCSEAQLEFLTCRYRSSRFPEGSLERSSEGEKLTWGNAAWIKVSLKIPREELILPTCTLRSRLCAPMVDRAGRNEAGQDHFLYFLWYVSSFFLYNC